MKTILGVFFTLFVLTLPVITRADTLIATSSPICDYTTDSNYGSAYVAEYSTLIESYDIGLYCDLSGGSYSTNCSLNFYDTSAGTFTNSTTTITATCVQGNQWINWDITDVSMSAGDILYLNCDNVTTQKLRRIMVSSNSPLYNNLFATNNSYQLYTQVTGNADSCDGVNGVIDYGEDCPECEVCTDCQYFDNEIVNDMTIISAYEETISTTTNRTQYHIPFLWWLVIFLVISPFLGRFLLEIIIKLRK